MPAQIPAGLLLGAHMPISGGFTNAIKYGEIIGATCIQIFTKSNQQWHARSISDEEAQQFKDAQKASAISVVVAHASYLINLASPKAAVRTKSIKALSTELERCEKLGIPYLVLHPGARIDTPLEQALEQVAQGLDEALENAPGHTRVLLETMAGQGSTVGSHFVELASIRKHASHKSRIGFCLDTCHVFAAGYDIRDKKNYEAMWAEFDREIGLEHLYAMHINDSKKDLDSHVDRHEHIGKGLIGASGFELLFNDPRFFQIPKILETPKDSLEEDRHNMEVIIDLLSAKTKKALAQLG